MIRLDYVLTGKEKSVEIPVTITPSDIADYMESLGYEQEIESNGWEHDFWVYYTKCNTRYVHSGCWYTGSNSFGVTEVEEEEEPFDYKTDPKYIKMIAEWTDTKTRIEQMAKDLGITDNDIMTVDDFERRRNELDSE